MSEVIKRDGRKVTFDESKIANAIKKANRDVAEDDRANDVTISRISKEIATRCLNRSFGVEEIQDIVEMLLMKYNHFKLAKAYIVYRYQRALVRRSNTTDKNILNIVQGKNKYWEEENSNKNANVASTQRDNIAGEVSRDLSERVLLPEDVVEAHEKGEIHFHDMDYFLQPIFNCCLINVQDMLDNGTVINGKLIEQPKSFQVACTVVTQIIATVASNQYGGQSVAVRHLAKYLRYSRFKYKKLILEELGVTNFLKRHKEDVGPSNVPYFEDLSEWKAKSGMAAELRKEDGNWAKKIDRVAECITNAMFKKELASGVQTIQYQINTLMTTNGQAPFVTLFLQLDEEDPYIEYTAMIVREILEQRLQGIKAESGAWVTPAFPKLIYVLDENNCLKGGRFDDITKLAVQCSAKRMYPDYISAKLMKEIYQGEIFSCMGCRSFLSPWKDENGNFKWEGRFNQGVVSLNLPQIGILSGENEDKFWEILEQRLAICYKALMCRHHALEGTVSNISPIHWQYGAIARLEKGEKIDKYLHGGYSTLSLGYIGLYEATKLVTGKSHTTPDGKKFAFAVMRRLRAACDAWKAATGLGFALYGTPAESLCYRFAEVDKKRFGVIEDVTDKGYYTNSYHVDVREKIDAFSKFKFESEFQKISSGGSISYVEVPDMQHNTEALEDLVKFIYDNILYAEFNTKSDHCLKCGFVGEVKLNDNLEWECPQCGNKDKGRLIVTRRTCGYLGENFWNVGKTKEISRRVTHL